MKCAAYGLLAAFLAQGTYGAIPTSAEGWYTPPGGFSRQSGSGTVVWNDEMGEVCFSTVTVDDEGRIGGGDIDFNGDVALMTAYNALVKACNTEAWNALQYEAIQTIADNLDSIFRTDGIQMEMAKQGPGGGMSTATYTLKIKPGGSGGASATIEATDPIPYGNVVDGKTVGWTRNSAAGQLQMYGANAATASTDDWWLDYGFFVPFLKGSNALGWKRYGGWYDGVFGTMQRNGRTMLTLAGWTGGRECNTDLKSILTEQSGDNRENHYVLTRYGTGTGAVFHYVPFGDRLEEGGGAPVDGSSLTTNTIDGASIQSEASLYGWSGAADMALPHKSDGRLAWKSPNEWVDGLSLDWADLGGVWKYQIKGFESSSACAASLSAMLSAPTGIDATTHLFLSKNTDDGTLHYVPIGLGLACGSPADAVTIVTNTTDGATEQGVLSLYGWSGAKNGSVLMKKDGKIAWEDAAGLQPDGITVVETVDSDNSRKFGLKGFQSAEKNSIPWKNENGELVWGGTSSATNVILAGAGINISDNGGGAITISAERLQDASSGSAAARTLSVIVDVRYDPTTHKFQCKRRQISFTGSLLGDDPQWEDVFEATSHKLEHSLED